MIGNVICAQGQVIVWLLMMFLAYAYMIAVRLHFTYSMMVMMKSPLVAAPHNDHCPGVEINVGINSTIDEKRMDWSLEEQSITMSAYFIGMLFTVFPGGVYANRGYEREIMGLCMFVSAVSVIFCPIAAVQLHSWIAVFVLRFFVGLVIIKRTYKYQSFVVILIRPFYFLITIRNYI